MRCALSFLGILVALVGCSKPETVVRIPVPAELKATPVAPTLAAPAHAEPAAEAQATDTKMAALPEELDPSIFSHVISQNGKIFVVLNYSPEESWGAGNPQLISDESPVVTRREIVDANLPGSLARRVGAPMHLFGAKGMVCHGKLGQLAMIGRVEPHFGERTRWQGGEEDENGIAQPPMTADEIAADAWQMSEMGIVLAAELIDVASWELLERLAREMGQDAIADRFNHALQQENEHLVTISGWYEGLLNADAKLLS